MTSSLTFFNIAATLLLATLVSAAKQHYNDNKVRLSDIDALTLQAGKQTTARRGSRVPQLACVSGMCDPKLQPVSVQCRNVGSDGVDAQWRCDADLDSSVKFGRLEVSCEGFSEPDDPFVLAGSCGLEYELVPTDPNKPQQRSGNQKQWKSAETTESRRQDESNLFGTLVRVGLITFIIWLVYRCVFKPSSPSNVAVQQSAYQAPRYGSDVRSPDEPPSYRSATFPSPSSGGGSSKATDFSSAASHLAAGAAGFAIGRATAPSASSAPTTTNTATNNTAVPASSQQKTGFATTKRR